MSQKIHGWYVPFTVIGMLCLTAIGRGLGYIYSLWATDIAYSQPLVSVMGVIVELVTVLRVCFGFGAVLYAMWRWEWTTPAARYRCGGIVAFAVWLTDCADGFTRYLVDSVTSSITGKEILALIWLLLQLCYSTVMLVLCFCTGRLLCRPDKHASVNRALTLSVLYVLAARLLLEIYYLVDFLTVYQHVTPAEISSIIGQFLYTIVLYGGVSWLAAMGVLWLLRRVFGKV